jgi:hypothetical protein
VKLNVLNVTKKNFLEAKLSFFSFEAKISFCFKTKIVKQNSARNLFAGENEICNAKLSDFFPLQAKIFFSFSNKKVKQNYV